MNQLVRDFHDEKIRICCEEAEVPKIVYEKLIEPFLSELNCGWLANSAAETRVKNYIGYVGGLMIRKPDEYNVMSDRKQRRVKGMEIPTDAIDRHGIRATPVPTKPNKKADTKAARMEAIRRHHPTAVIEACRVDTEGVFRYGDGAFRISGVEEYSAVPLKTGDDVFYPMDRVIVADDICLTFYDQNGEPISEGGVIRIC